MSRASHPCSEGSVAIPLVGNINNYNSLPTTRYLQIVDSVESEIKLINKLVVTDEDRVLMLKNSLASLIVKWSDNDDAS